jgi:hypothetical protein
MAGSSKTISKLTLTIDIILKNRQINDKYCLPCFVLLVLLVVIAQIHFEEQALVGGTKQSRQAWANLSYQDETWAEFATLS